MNVWKPIAIGLAAGLALSIGIRTASADRNPTPAPAPARGGGCGGQIHMNAALISLEQALAELKQAEHNKHNWRVSAIGSVNAAIEQTNTGCNAAN